MIYTITVNPTIDVTNVCEKPVKAGTTRPFEQWAHAGGKGVDVSRVVRNLGGTSVAMGFLGGFTGRRVEGRLLAEGLELDMVRISEETRTNVIIIAPEGEGSRKKVLDYRYNSPGPVVQDDKALELYERIKNLANVSAERKPTHVAVCGSLCEGMHATFYVTIIRYFKNMGAVVALDSSGSALKESLRYAPRPHIIKPNIVEFDELINGALTSNLSDKKYTELLESKGKHECLGSMCGEKCGMGTSDPSVFWKLLLKQARLCFDKFQGLTAILLTLGARGILLILQDKLLHGIYEGTVKVVCPVGAGDTALAALLFSMEKGEHWETALRLAVAAATASVTKQGTESPSLEDIEKYEDKVNIHQHQIES